MNKPGGEVRDGRPRARCARHGRIAPWAVLAAGLAALPAQAITIEDAVKESLTSNPQVTGASAGVRAAGQDVRQARAGYFPSLDLDNRWGREHTNIKQLS